MPTLHLSGPLPLNLSLCLPCGAGWGQEGNSCLCTCRALGRRNLVLNPNGVGERLGYMMASQRHVTSCHNVTSCRVTSRDRVTSCDNVDSTPRVLKISVPRRQPERLWQYSSTGTSTGWPRAPTRLATGSVFNGFRWPPGCSAAQQLECLTVWRLNRLAIRRYDYSKAHATSILIPILS